jgi:hypothetical protein
VGADLEYDLLGEVSEGCGFVVTLGSVSVILVVWGLSSVFGAKSFAFGSGPEVVAFVLVVEAVVLVGLLFVVASFAGTLDLVVCGFGVDLGVGAVDFARFVGFVVKEAFLV